MKYLSVSLASQAESPGSRLGPPFSIRVLVACGWLSPTDSADPDLKVETLNRAHVVSRVTAPDGRAVVVKHPAQRDAGDGRDLLREMFVYRLGKWVPEIAAILPKAILIDEARQVLVLEVLESTTGQPWPTGAEPPAITNPGVVTRLAEAMARWHNATKEVALWPSLADGVLHLPDELEDVVDHRSPSGRAFLRFLVDDQQCAATLREARTVYRHGCLIHGDIRCDNWLLTRDKDRPELKIIDWEMSGSGDPAWDIASAFAESILQGIRDGLILESGSSGWPPFVEPVISTFLRCYLSAGGEEASWDHIVLFTASRLMHVASEWAEYGAEGEANGANLIIAQVRNLVEHRVLAAASLREWAGH